MLKLVSIIKLTVVMIAVDFYFFVYILEGDSVQKDAV